MFPAAKINSRARTACKSKISTDLVRKSNFSPTTFLQYHAVGFEIDGVSAINSWKLGETVKTLPFPGASLVRLIDRIGKDLR
jgi:hypothetical protein